MAEWIDFTEVPKDREYDSSFESDVEANARKEKLKNLITEKKRHEKVANKRQLEEELIKEEGKAYRSKAVALDAYSRHKEYINNYLLYYGGNKKEFTRDTSKDKTDADIIKENHKFLWDEEDETLSWEQKLAKRYYDKLFKEYCIADLSRYKENKIGMRWRIEQEVIDGKGQFICGNKKCHEKEEDGSLRSWEVNFGYIESGVKKNVLIKLRLCPDCSYKLNYKRKYKDVSRKKEELTSSQGNAGNKKQRIDEAGPSDDKLSRSEKDKTSETEVSRDEDVWSQPVKMTEEKSREDEFDSYFKDMFL